MKIPFSFSYPLTPAQFAVLVPKLSSNPAIKSITLVNNGAEIVTADVTLTGSFNGIDRLLVTVTAQHSLAAHLASDAQAQEHITELLAKAVQ